MPRSTGTQRFLAKTLLALALPAFGAGCDADRSPQEAPREGLGEAPQAGTSCDFGPSVKGIDVSYYQDTIDWPTVAADGWKYAWARVSHSTSFMDPQFDANWEGIKAAGMLRGCYQFFEPAEDPLAQAQVVIDAIGQLGPGDLPAMIDVEAPDPGVSPATYAQNIQAWLDAVEAGTGKKPLIYTGYYYWNDYVGSDAFGDYPLWVANYNPDCPLVPMGWDDWTFWQWQASDPIVGIPSAAVDHDLFKGTEDDLNALANGSGGSYAATLGAIDAPVTVVAGETFEVSITYTNSGGATWDASTFLGTSEPRDRESVFHAATWPSPNRAAVVEGAAPPGSTYKFDFSMTAPDAPGAYAESFALVQEGVTWFADAGGPPDDAVRLAIQVVEGGDAAAGSGGGSGDGGAPGDDDDDVASASAGDGGDDGTGSGGSGGSGSDEAEADDGCAVHGGSLPTRGTPIALALAAMTAALWRRRRGGGAE